VLLTGRPKPPKGDFTLRILLLAVFPRTPPTWQGEFTRGSPLEHTDGRRCDLNKQKCHRFIVFSISTQIQNVQKKNWYMMR